VWVASESSDSSTGYTSAYNLSYDENETLNYIGFNQAIKILSTGKEIIVSSPNTAVQNYGPYPDLAKLGDNNTFIDGDIVKYRLEFDALSPNAIHDIGVTFDINYSNLDGVEFEVTGLNLQKMNSNGKTFNQIKDLNSSFTKDEYANVYSLKLGNNISGNPIIKANGIGRYAVELTGKITIKDHYTDSVETIRVRLILMFIQIHQIFLIL
jgi:hypothetical protein